MAIRGCDWLAKITRSTKTEGTRKTRQSKLLERVKDPRGYNSRFAIKAHCKETAKCTSGEWRQRISVTL